MEHTVKVKDMSCKHCVIRIEKSLKDANIDSKVDLESKTVSFNGDKNAAIQAIKDAGYSASDTI